MLLLKKPKPKPKSQKLVLLKGLLSARLNKAQFAADNFINKE